MRAYQTNVKGAMVTTRAFLPSHNPDASIVGITADLINHPASHPIAAGTSAYASSKFAQLKLLEYVAAEHPDLFVVSAHPGCVDTDMLKSMGASEAAIEQGFIDDGGFLSFSLFYFCYLSRLFLSSFWYGFQTFVGRALTVRPK